jgi:dipeptidyl aminopeptidase/acylaminoacyl peptidase
MTKAANSMTFLLTRIDPHARFHRKQSQPSQRIEMRDKIAAPYGSWKSPVTSGLVSSRVIRLDRQVEVDGKDIYWVEMRPEEGGRSVIVGRSPDGRIADVTPKPFNARTRVHEYGGGGYKVDRGTVYFSNFTDQRLYRQSPNSAPEPITSEGGMRYADGVIDHRRNRMICVCQDHTSNDKEPENCLAAITLDRTGHVQKLVFGNDFYSSPRINTDGSALAWLTWNHPNMPWDYTELWVSEIREDGSIGNPVHVAGGKDESICQPQYSPDGTLYFISERTGWWNLYCWRNGSTEALCPMEAEFGLPHWVFGMSTYSFESGHLVCSYAKDGSRHLASLDLATRELKEIKVPYTSISTIRGGPGFVVLLAGSPTEAESIIRLEMASGKLETLRRSTDVTVPPEYLSVPEAIEFPTEGRLTSHALYYKAKNGDYAGPAGERPPLVVVSHGGPTGATSSVLNLSIQFWTSHGFAVADVDYGGSTGYGRAYRQRLDGRWGIADVDDCVNCARYLIERGEVDERRTAIRGASAGGYTTLAALAFRDVFKAGASYFGVSDLEALARDTHKFESRYLDRMVGPYPGARELYLERSPINHVERLSCPIIFFQGDEDKVVPPDQAEAMVNALRRKGIPTAYILFQGEQHGFRQAQNIKRALDAELYFYSRIFGFELADGIDPALIDNLP